MSQRPINEEEYFDRLDFSEFDGGAEDFLSITSPRSDELCGEDDDPMGLYERYDY